MPSSPELSALLVIGDSRARAQRALDSLYAQSAAARMEVVVVDIASGDAPALVVSDRVPTRSVKLAAGTAWGHARIVAVRMANSPIAAFIEDHCTAAAGWAEALIEAHRGPWVAVGYAYTNPRPQSYLAGAILTAEYGRWLHPTTSRPAHLLGCGNVSYKRDLLLSLGDDLATLLTPDFILQEWINGHGLRMWVESRAVIAHDSLATLGDMMAASFLFCRIYGGRRAVTQRWSVVKRLFYASATPLASPFIALWRLASSRRRTATNWMAVLASLPVIVLKGVVSALGESLGYLAGAGQSERGFDKWEVHVDRGSER